MTSEIRANTIKNRVGLGTVSYTNTGVVVSGIVTANSFSGPLNSTGDITSTGNITISNTTPTLTFTDTDANPDFQIKANTGHFYFVDATNNQTRFYVSPDGATNFEGNLNANRDFSVERHTNLDNVSISGVTTFTGAITANSTLYVGSDLTITDKIVHNGDTNTAIRFPAADQIQLETGGSSRVNLTNDRFQILNRLLTSGDYNYLSGTSTTTATLTLKKSSSGADSIDYLQLRDNSNALLFKISGEGILYTSDVLASHEGDTDTKIRFPAGNTISMETAGDERLRIDSSGKVGINQVPTRELSLHSPDNNNALIHFTNDDTGETASDGILIGLNGNEDCIVNNQESGKNIIVYTHNGSSVGERLRIDSSGRLSFAGDTDTYIWHPSANQLAITRGGGSFPIVRIGTGGNGGTIGIGTDSNLVTSGEIISVRGYSTFKSVNNLYAALYTHNEQQGGGNICAHILLNVGGANRGGFGYDTDNSTLIMGNHNAISFRTGVTNLNGTERLLIKNTGGVGINTSLIRNNRFLNIAAPSQDFSNNSVELMDGGGICLQHTDTLASTNRTYPGIFWSGNTASLGRARAAILGITASNNDATDIVFLTRYAANGTGLYPSDERMRIMKDGRVGIKFKGDYTMNSQSTDLVIGDGGGGRGITIWTAGAADNQTISFQTNETLSRAEGEISYGPSATSTVADRNAMMFRVNSAERLRITSTGNTRIGVPPTTGSSSLISEKQATIGTKHFYTVYHNFSSTNSPLAVNSKIPHPACGTVEVVAGWANGNGLRLSKFHWTSSGSTSGCVQIFTTTANRYGVSVSIGTPTMSISGDYTNFSFTFSDSQGSKMEKLKIHFEYFNQFRIDG